jgi:hypothetical protein
MERRREIKKQKDEMTEEKKFKECLCCSSVFTKKGGEKLRNKKMR